MPTLFVVLALILGADWVNTGSDFEGYSALVFAVVGYVVWQTTPKEVD